MTPLPADRVLEQFFHECRSKLLDVAAILDRMGRGDNTEAIADDPRTAVEDALTVIERFLEGLRTPADE